jgi:predicted DsbA family dithiol-disulfide isomerase
MKKPVIQIDVVSDVVCPWCYIGKRRLEKAIDAVSDRFDFEVNYHPFELNPTIPQEGLDQKEYLTAKFGGEERYDQLTGKVSSVAASEGITFNFNNQAVSPNTRNMHRIIRLAAEHGVQKEVVEAFFKAYFTEGKDLSKNTELTLVASEAGLAVDLIEKLLASEDHLAEVIAAETQMQSNGITGVPYYILNNKYGVSGAQASATFISAFKQIGGEIITSSESCSVDEKNC